MTANDHIAYIGIGSNQANPIHQVQTALQALDELPLTRCGHHSRLYRTQPVGVLDQPEFINAVAAITTQLNPHQLLEALQQIENKQGRIREQHWGPRTLDLDILLYGDRVVTTPTLTIPHPAMTERAFVLMPLAEIAPHLRLPSGVTIQQLLTNPLLVGKGLVI